MLVVFFRKKYSSLRKIGLFPENQIIIAGVETKKKVSDNPGDNTGTLQHFRKVFIHHK